MTLRVKLISAALLIASTALFSPSPAAESQTETCGVIAGPPGGETKFQPVAGLSVLRQTEGVGSFAVTAPEGQKVAAIMCSRSDIVPAPHDYKVLLAGYPLYLKSEDGTLTIVLEISGGQLRVRALAPIGSQEMMEKIQAALNAMQTEMDAAR